MKKNVRILAACLMLVLAGSSSALAQTRPGRGRGLPGGGPLADGGVAPAELQRLFDAYIVMQAQQQLQLTDDQFARFLTRVRTLQEVRRRGQMERGRLLQELRRVSETPAQDDAVRAQLKAFADLEGRQFSDLRQAIEGVDQVLDLHQQARFRLFEEQMERRKVELMMRARQGNRPRMPTQP